VHAQGRRGGQNNRSGPSGPPLSRVRRIALTGGIATGKSRARSLFEHLGVPTIDSDVLAREAVAPGTAGLAAVSERFGPDVLQPDGSLDRDNLAKIVFADPESRRALESIIHPYVRRRTDEWFARLDAARHPYAIADIPLLYEVERDQDFDAVIVVACDPDTQLRRLLERGMTASDARQRIAAQSPLDDKIARADHVIRTNGGFEETDRQIQELHAILSR
jgi:dephospho-CoA kinase